MNTDWCYAGFGWRVYKDNQLVGFVVASSEKGAMSLAQNKYGDSVKVVKVSAP